MNCRACHGDSVAGDGPMADGFKLRPINFADNGTIETIVEGLVAGEEVVVFPGEKIVEGVRLARRS